MWARVDVELLIENAGPAGSGWPQRKEKECENGTIKLVKVEMSTGQRRAEEDGQLPESDDSSSEQRDQ